MPVATDKLLDARRTFPHSTRRRCAGLGCRAMVEDILVRVHAKRLHRAPLGQECPRPLTGLVPDISRLVSFSAPPCTTPPSKLLLPRSRRNFLPERPRWSADIRSRSTTDSIQVSEACDDGSIPSETTRNGAQSPVCQVVAFFHWGLGGV